jgi:pyruvate dehydrogenase E2 component (dihydrolipoamide acetyltransferase)
VTGTIHPITMPKWGIEMQEGTVTAWHFAPGQSVAKGDALLDVETEKIVNSVEAPVSGVLRRIIGAPGEVRAVGELIGVFAGADVPEAEVERFIGSFVAADASFEPRTTTPQSAAPASTAAPAPATAGPAVADTDAEGDARVSPIARRVAIELGVDLGQVRGTGRNGRISKQDVEAFAAARGATAAGAAASAGAARAHDSTAASAPIAGETPAVSRERLSATRATIARRLLESKQQIPHFRLCITVDAAPAVAHRAALRDRGIAVSLNDLVVRACALALVQHRDLNARFEGDEILRYRDADVCVAVATDAGLMTPVVRAANAKEVRQIAAETADLADKARTGRLAREDIAGGSFTVSNLGMHGVERFDAVINPPQVAILAVGAVRSAIVPIGGAPAVGQVMELTLSCDHRVVDGAVGAGFLATLRDLLEHPDRL